MASWSEFAAASPRLAEEIRALLQQYGPGLGYLATVRADGGPRVHPVAPIVTDDGLYCFLIDSPKRRDLERDGRFALHTFPADDSDLEGYLSGWAAPVYDLDRVERIALQARANDVLSWRLFELHIEVAMVHRPVGQTDDRQPRLGSTQVWRERTMGHGFRRIHRQLSLIGA